ncbi:MAG: hypothetical protein J7527_02710 [Chitinophagaceae bacterium]|nr:hypothetical protein [Chitinophagaceae bacterium]
MLTFSGAGDQTLSLGRYQIGGSIELLFRAEGNYSEVGGVYHIIANWGQMPVVAYRAESNLSRLKFYSYVDPAGGGFMFLFATWENQSPGKASSNTLHFKMTSFGSIQTGVPGTFANASL